MYTKKSPRYDYRRLWWKNGGYLLSHFLGSTIGAIGLNFSVRNGKRWIPNATTTLNKVNKFISETFVYVLETEKNLSEKTWWKE